MRTSGIVYLALFGLSLPLLAEAQSLGSVARKERERRDKNKKEGVVAREFSEEEILGEKGNERAPEGEPLDNPEANDGARSEDAALAPESSKLVGTDRLDSESRERQRNEAEWRSKAFDARERISKAREQVRFLEELHLGPNEYYVDEIGRPVIDSVEELQQMMRAAREELAAAEQSWKQLQEEARRSGIPPGWLR